MLISQLIEHLMPKISNFVILIAIKSFIILVEKFGRTLTTISTLILMLSVLLIVRLTALRLLWKLTINLMLLHHLFSNLPNSNLMQGSFSPAFLIMLTFHQYVQLVKSEGKERADYIFDSMLDYFSSCGPCPSAKHTAYKQVLYGSI